MDAYLYNYESILNLNKNNDNKIIFEKLYLTNNMEESLNAKINYYLP